MKKLHLSGWNEMGANKTKAPFGAGIRIIWEEQLVDPPIDYLTSVNVP